VAHAQLSKQSVDGAQLDASFAARIAQGCGTDMVFPVWLKQRQSGKAFDDPGLRFRTGEALQELLEDQACGDDDL